MFALLDKIIGFSLFFLFYIFPALVIFYFLVQFLVLQLVDIKRDAVINRKWTYIKIGLIMIGLLYCIFLFSFVTFMVFRPSWFYPPVWLKIVSIVLFVPYASCVLGFIGLGNIGRSGFSPWKDFNALFNNAKDGYKSRIEK